MEACSVKTAGWREAKSSRKRDSVAGAWEGRSQESCEVHHGLPVGYWASHLSAFLGCSPLPTWTLDLALSFVECLGVTKCFVWSSLSSGPLALGLQMLTCTWAFGTTTIQIATTGSSCPPSRGCKFLEMLDWRPLRGEKGEG